LPTGKSALRGGSWEGRSRSITTFFPFVDANQSL
jgi:hypothetical protein